MLGFVPSPEPPHARYLSGTCHDDEGRQSGADSYRHYNTCDAGPPCRRVVCSRPTGDPARTGATPQRSRQDARRAAGASADDPTRSGARVAGCRCDRGRSGGAPRPDRRGDPRAVGTRGKGPPPPSSRRAGASASRRGAGLSRREPSCPVADRDRKAVPGGSGRRPDPQVQESRSGERPAKPAADPSRISRRTLRGRTAVRPSDRLVRSVNRGPRFRALQPASGIPAAVPRGVPADRQPLDSR